MKQIFIDIETTGLNPESDKIIQIAGIIKVNGKIKEKFDFKTNIYINFLNLLDKHINKFDKNDKAYFLAYNAKFDNDFIRKLFLDNNNKFIGSYFYNPVIDVLQMTSYKFMLKKKFPENFKLITVAKFLQIKVDENKLHNAAYDIFITNEIYKKLIKM